MQILTKIFTNKAIIIPAAAWLFAQLIKVITSLIIDKGVALSRLFGSGGMPSSHTCYIMTLAALTGKNIGWDSVEFGIVCAFAFIVMYDATGVRRAAGRQAKLLNSLMSTHFAGDEFNEKLKELLGHRPQEVFVGAIIGVIIGLLFG